jgi:hypothetical protein
MFIATASVGRAAATRENTDTEEILTGSVANNYTFNSIALGTAIGTSLVVVVAHVNSNGTSPQISSISIDGTDGTLHQQRLATNSLTFDASSGIASRATSNTSGTIIVRCNNGSLRCRIEVFRLNKLRSATVFDSDGAQNVTPANATINLDIPGGGIVIAGATVVGANNATVPSLTGVTEDGSGVFSGANLYKWVYGSDQSQPAATGSAITSVLPVGGLANALVAASWH